MASPKLNEAHIQATCTAFLQLDGWRALRTDPVSRREWGKGFGEPGMADHLYIRYGRYALNPTDGHIGSRTWTFNANGVAEVMWIEFKRLRGTKATGTAQHQKQWHVVERAHGALTLIAGEDFPATIEGFEAWYRASGLMRNPSIRMQ